jgi:hypothetical protein
MKELEDHLHLVCQMIEDEHCHFRSFLQEIRKRTECLCLFSPGLLQTREEEEREEEK